MTEEDSLYWPALPWEEVLGTITGTHVVSYYDHWWMILVTTDKFPEIRLCVSTPSGYFEDNYKPASRTWHELIDCPEVYISLQTTTGRRSTSRFMHTLAQAPGVNPKEYLSTLLGIGVDNIWKSVG